MQEEGLYISTFLFSRVAAGDELAFGEVFHIANRQFYPFVRALLKSDEDTREVIQEVFLKLWVQREKLADVENPGAWIRTVMVNAAYDHLRRRATYEQILIRSQSTKEHGPDDSYAELDAREIRNFVLLAMEQLPERRKEIFRLSKLEGLTRREVAEKMKISENTVRNQLSEAMEHVQNFLKENRALAVPLSIILLTW